MGTTLEGIHPGTGQGFLPGARMLPDASSVPWQQDDEDPEGGRQGNDPEALPSPPSYVIHPSAWNRNSAKFAAIGPNITRLEDVLIGPSCYLGCSRSGGERK